MVLKTNEATALFFIMFFPVTNIFIDERWVDTNNTSE